LLEVALEYRVNMAMHELEKRKAENSNNKAGITAEIESSESSDSGSEKLKAVKAVIVVVRMKWSFWKVMWW